MAQGESKGHKLSLSGSGCLGETVILCLCDGRSSVLCVNKRLIMYT